MGNHTQQITPGEVRRPWVVPRFEPVSVRYKASAYLLCSLLNPHLVVTFPVADVFSSLYDVVSKEFLIFPKLGLCWRWSEAVPGHETTAPWEPQNMNHLLCLFFYVQNVCIWGHALQHCSGVLLALYLGSSPGTAQQD